MSWLNMIGDKGKRVAQNTNGELIVQSTSGVQMDFYGATITERPDPTSVPVGAYYKAVDTQEYWQTNGTSWVVV